MTIAETNNDSKVQVAVRVRPVNKREIDLATKCVVQMGADQTLLHHPNGEKQVKTFAFDHCFDSAEPNSRNFASQECVFNKIGNSVVDNAFAGYNACIFAYGQTGSGKSYTMMGSADNPGIIPRLCNSIFERIDIESSASASFKVEVSYMEIYNERVRDLLDPKKSAKSNLKVREHSSLGPTVDGLSILAVSSFDQIARLLDEGNKCRTVAATNMNAESSRSHAVFTIRLTQTLSDLEKDFSGEKVAKVSLVDLAGSERAGKTGAMGKRLEEGGNINKSLTTLGMVISALAERSGKKDKFIPYRDSVLTWLLKDNLGGNSRTIMIATVSPAADNYEETLSTLRYADRAKKIVNHAVVNEDPNAKIIRELREEVETLRMQITTTKERETEYEELRERLAESERLVEMMNKSWEERLKETDIVYEERQRDLAQIGISVAESGIKVGKDRFYLVNLNADPAISELLVYYVNKRALIGNGVEDAREDELKTDFVLQGLAVLPKHALLDIVQDEITGLERLFIEPLTDGAGICVNGKAIHERTLLKNGSRLLIGHNHFFRVHCPKDPRDENALMMTSIMEESQFFDYDSAWNEVNGGENMSHAVDQYLEQINIKHQEEKQAALEKQYEEFERYIHGLTQTLQTPSTPMTPAAFGMGSVVSTPSCGLPPIAFPSNPRNMDKTKFFKWAQKREELFKESLRHLRTQIVRANALTREANMIADELMANKRGHTRYDVTLQIPAANLRPSRIKVGTSVCEPVIVVKRNGIQGNQTMTMEQLENKLIDLREMYNDRINGSQVNGNGLMQSTTDSIVSESPTGLSSSSGICADEEMDDDYQSSLVNTFFECQENHNLIGVANVFLEVLFHDMKLDYHVPIISQQGVVSGKLHVQVYRLPSEPDMNASTDSVESNGASGGGFLNKTIRCRVRIKKASNLPANFSQLVFCQFCFFNISKIQLAAAVDTNTGSHRSTTVKFEYEEDFEVLVTEEFLEYVQEDALSIEVWGHRSAGLENDHGVTVEPGRVLAKRVQHGVEPCSSTTASLQERWMEVMHRIRLWVDIKELNDAGEWSSVVVDHPENASGGIYQLKQGQQRRVSVHVQSVPERGSLPLTFSDVSSVFIGSVCVRAADDERQLDSYQEIDLDKIREQWMGALSTRQKYLEQQMSALSEKGSAKTALEVEREQSLINQWVALTEERNVVSVPTPNSTIPGAPADNWNPPPGMEHHVPVLFLDINPDEFAAQVDDEGTGSPRMAGLDCPLSAELFDQMVLLPMVEKDTIEMTATCSWDSSIHACPALNRPTQSGERVYAIVRVAVQTSYPVAVSFVLRKRICLNVYKKQPSFTERLMKRIVGGESLFGSGVFYDIVAHVPKASLDMEDRETLALMAARHTSTNEEDVGADGGIGVRVSSMSYVEAYTKSIQAVEWMLKLDRLRQESAMFNMLSKQERAARLSNGGLMMPSNSFRMKRAVSLPNTINNVSLPPIPPPVSGFPHHPPVYPSHRYSAVNGHSQLPPPSSMPLASEGGSKVMETSTSSSSGYSSMVNSLVSPMMEHGSGRLSGIDEEQQIQLAELFAKEPTRSFTVPETLHSSVNEHFLSKNVPAKLAPDLNCNSSDDSHHFSCANRLFDQGLTAEDNLPANRLSAKLQQLDFTLPHA